MFCPPSSRGALTVTNWIPFSVVLALMLPFFTRHVAHPPSSKLERREGRFEAEIMSQPTSYPIAFVRAAEIGPVWSWFMHMQNTAVPGRRGIELRLLCRSGNRSKKPQLWARRLWALAKNKFKKRQMMRKNMLCNVIHPKRSNKVINPHDMERR